jgi:undecaprenyl-diphosphatase
MDPIMWWISSTVLWIPFYFILMTYLIKSQTPALSNPWLKQTGIILLSISLAILLADQISSGFFKPFFERPRPSHSPEIMDLVHVLIQPNGEVYRGGPFGFISSHAANSFAIAWFVSLILKNKTAWFIMVSWAILVSYSRIYLGVHYPGDILGGAFIGIGSGTIAAYVYHKLHMKWMY